MSVDVSAELPAPISLSTVVQGTGEVLRALLDLAFEPPPLEVIEGWHVEDHLRVSSGRPMSAEELAASVMGGSSPARGDDGKGSLAFEVRPVGSGDRAYLLVIDLATHPAGAPLIKVVVSPTRTCVGVVLATAVALSAASASGGEFVDIEIIMLDAVAWQGPGKVARCPFRVQVGPAGYGCPGATDVPTRPRRRRSPAT
ncbi:MULTISPECIES: hypothetical protein [Streptacidiphilus]|uniref:Uncharacterized protein n=1 Tax=Streptacidiphilus cavernicola TaxID=3342716 RepID=A0ABV6UZT6_9ACTN|nr:hypothetical protein [Streptacidiphilus jeojiense]